MTANRARRVSELVEQQKLIAILRTASEADALYVAEAIADAGVRLIDIPMTVPNAVGVLETLAANSDLVLGAGSITNMEDTVDVIERGAGFVITPNTDRMIIDYCRDNDVFVAAGGLTPTEVMVAHLAGVDMVTVYPVTSIGGPEYIRHLLTPMPFLKLMATGTVSIETAKDFIDSGAIAVGVSSLLCDPEKISCRDFDGIRQNAVDFLAAVQSADKEDSD